jgi:hypothetical protein
MRLNGVDKPFGIFGMVYPVRFGHPAWWWWTFPQLFSSWRNCPYNNGLHLHKTATRKEAIECCNLWFHFNQQKELSFFYGFCWYFLGTYPSLAIGCAGKLVKWLTFVDNYFPHINGKTCIKFVIYADNTCIDFVFTNKDVRRFSRLAGNFWSLNRKDSTTGSHKVAEVVISRTYKRILSFLHFFPRNIDKYLFSTNFTTPSGARIFVLSKSRDRGIMGSWDRGGIMGILYL